MAEQKENKNYPESLIELTKMFLLKVETLKPRERKAIALLIERLSEPVTIRLKSVEETSI